MESILRRWGGRAVVLLVTGIGLYVVTPSMVALLGQWPELRGVRALWFAVLLVLEVGSWVCLWVLVRMLLPGTAWTTVGSAQMAGLASSCVLPGGAATGSVIQATMLVRAGHAPARVGAALGSVGLLTTGMLLALPILTLPAVLIQPPPARQLQLGLVVSLVVAVALVLLGLALLHWDSFMCRHRTLRGARRPRRTPPGRPGLRGRTGGGPARRGGDRLRRSLGPCPDLRSGEPHARLRGPASRRCTPSAARLDRRWCFLPTSSRWRSPWCRSRPAVSDSSRRVDVDPRARRGGQQPGGRGDTALPGRLVLVAGPARRARLCGVALHGGTTAPTRDVAGWTSPVSGDAPRRSPPTFEPGPVLGVRRRCDQGVTMSTTHQVRRTSDPRRAPGPPAVPPSPASCWSRCRPSRSSKGSQRSPTTDLRPRPSYAYKVDLTAWGWLHLVLGVIGIATGAGILAAGPGPSSSGSPSRSSARSRASRSCRTTRSGPSSSWPSTSS